MVLHIFLYSFPSKNKPLLWEKEGFQTPPSKHIRWKLWANTNPDSQNVLHGSLRLWHAASALPNKYMNGCGWSLGHIKVVEYRSLAGVNPDCGQIGTCHTPLNLLKADLTAAWLEGISTRMPQQEKPLGWPEEAEKSWPKDPICPLCWMKLAKSLQRASVHK